MAFNIMITNQQRYKKHNQLDTIGVCLELGYTTKMAILIGMMN